VVIDEGPPFFDPGTENLITDVTLTGRLSLEDGSGSNTATNVTFVGDPGSEDCTAANPDVPPNPHLP